MAGLIDEDAEYEIMMACIDHGFKMNFNPSDFEGSFNDEVEGEEQFRPVSAFAMERHLRSINKALDGKDFKDIDEMNAYLQSVDYKNESGKQAVGDTAQELAYQAMEAASIKDAVSLAKQALEFDSGCLDALVVLAVSESKDVNECIERLEKAVAVGERALGSDFFEENKGEFWGITETRPYMRVREALAQNLVLAKRYGEAEEHYEAMMELNPNDNQGVRFSLLSCYLILRDLDGAERLFNNKPEEYMDATLYWGKVLWHYLSDDMKGACMTLCKARAENSYVEDFFSGKKKIPTNIACAYSFGSMEEAEMIAFELGEAWLKYPEAMRWLRLGGSDSNKNSGLRVVK
jgi:tetratricopeptide (TPR) repeat protein